MLSNDGASYDIDGIVHFIFAFAGLLYSQVVVVISPPQPGDCDRASCWRTRPAQRNSLASVTCAAIQSIFQHLDMVSAARLASTCKVCFEEHQHDQNADICGRAYQQCTPDSEVTVKLRPLVWS